MANGALFLVGGDEFTPGNEPHDRAFVAAARDGPAYLVATAAVRQDPDRTVRTARRWFDGLGLRVDELPLRGRRQANDPAIADAAAAGSAFYLCGGDPGLVVTILRETLAWHVITGAWRDGAALAGSSAGAMALGEWTLLRARRPGDPRRRYAPALGVLHNIVLVPHLEQSGRRWLPSALDGRPRRGTIVLGVDSRTAAAWIPGRGRGWTVTGSGGVEVVAPGVPRRVAAGRRLTSIPAPGAASRRGQG